MADTPNDMKPKKQKKSETLEVRLPYETKQAFLTACREDGTTASEVVRTSIDTYLESGRPAPQPETTGNVLAMIPKPLRRPRLALGAAGAIGLAVFATLPSAAAPDFKSQFNRFDTNKDGVISLDEFASRGQDGAAKSVTAEDGTSVVLSMRHADGGTPPAAPLTSSQEDAYTFWLPEVGGKGGGADSEYKFVQHNEIRITGDHDAGKDAGAADPGAPQIKRSFRMCTKSDGDEKPVCTESGDPPPDFKAMTFNMADMRKSEFKQYDADGDGRVSFGEYQARQTAMLTRGFQMLDQNSDGSLSAEEYARIVNPPMPTHAGAAGAVAGTIALSGVMMAQSKYTPEVLKAAFQKLDKNGDGKLSLQEYLPQS